MTQTIWSKRIPTLLGLIVIIAGVLITTYLVESGVIYVGKASPSTTPKDVTISNITDTSFTVSFTTTEATTSLVSFGQDNQLGQTALNIKDTSINSLSKNSIHFITLTNLKPNTLYYFSITSGGGTYLKDGLAYQTKTAPSVRKTQTAQKKLNGTVMLPNGEKLSEGLVYLSSTNTQDISAFVENGNYSLDLTSLRNKTLDSFSKITENTTFTMKVLGKDGQSQVTLFTKDSQIPPITLSQNYDFTVDSTPLDVIPSQIGGLPLDVSFPSTARTATTLQITTPKRNEEFIDSRPQFKGTAIPGKQVFITIPTTITLDTQIRADSSGNWSYRPPMALNPGTYSISIASDDAAGVRKTLSQTFRILSSGSRVSQTATPSASPTIGITATPTPTIRVATPTPTTVLVPTISPTTPILPSPTTVVLAPSKTEEPGNELVLFGGILALATTTLGMLLFLVTHWTTL